MLSTTQKEVDTHPLVRDRRRRSLLNPFLTVAAASHWEQQTLKKRHVKLETWMKKQTPSKIFLKEVGLCLSDPQATDLEHVVSLCSLVRALMQSQHNPQGATASDIFHRRLVPPISAVATDKKSKRASSFVFHLFVPLLLFMCSKSYNFSFFFLLFFSFLSPFLFQHTLSQRARSVTSVRFLLAWQQQ